MSKRYETVNLDVEDGVAVLTLNRPDKLNSFSAGMHEDLRAALAHVDGAIRAPQPVRALLLTGAGRAFCAGQDLSERQRAPGAPPPDLGASLRENYSPLIMRISQLPIPVVAAVNGVAAGSGANLALACDFVVAARSARFLQSFCRIGLIPDAGGTWMLPRLVGMARARGLTFLGEALSADEALRWGLIWQVVEDEQLMLSAMALVRRLAEQATRGLALQKQAFAASSGNSLEEQLELEARLQAEAGRTADYAEGVAGFFEKRAPHFRGQ
jgi:2-(1,2-epoxy-1,2-dihydrophenyl)acetyl-CoA isomerase